MVFKVQYQYCWSLRMPVMHPFKLLRWKYFWRPLSSQELYPLCQQGSGWDWTWAKYIHGVFCISLFSFPSLFFFLWMNLEGISGHFSFALYLTFFGIHTLQYVYVTRWVHKCYLLSRQGQSIIHMILSPCHRNSAEIQLHSNETSLFILLFVLHLDSTLPRPLSILNEAILISCTV